MGSVNADGLEILLQEEAILTDCSGKGNVQSCFGKRDCLVKALAAFVFRVGGGGKRLSLLDQMGQMIGVVNVQGTKYKQLHRILLTGG